ncbi:hypothetical protein HAZT_HAZT011318 [Hyalella azteca]|uniref:Chloride channel protein n=1 Tax=Hyalella azteca TaxID=294128 RepID=A0A6A0GNT7_HYAAZ|nr:hypothetical protein HAZT_HAZT011318 [Hyalella azteca]
MFHHLTGTYQVLTLVVHFIMTSLIACYTYGLGVPSGLFIPSLLNGASFGRLIGVLMSKIYPNAPNFSEGKYALAGASAFLAGVVRMTLSLVCILMESCGSVTFTVTLMFIIFVAKYVGDKFNHGLYDVHIRLNGVPFLEPKPDPQLETLFAKQAVSSPVVCLRPVESVRRLLIISRLCTYNGFPVVWNDKVALYGSQDRPGSACSRRSTSLVVDADESSYKHQAAVQIDLELPNSSMDETDVLDEVLRADAHYLKRHYEKLNVRLGLTSEEVRSSLLTDSCINRFSELPCDDEEEDEDHMSYVPVSHDANMKRHVHWYNTESAPQDLDAHAKRTLYEAQGILCGLVLRSQIMVMLKNKMFIEKEGYLNDTFKDLRLFRDAYPRFYDLEAVDLTPEDLDCHVDFRPYMNPAPHTVSTRMNFTRVFESFRSLGLRHQVMVNNRYNVVGMITRKDLVKLYTKKTKDGISVLRMTVHERA